MLLGMAIHCPANRSTIPEIDLQFVGQTEVALSSPMVTDAALVRHESRQPIVLMRGLHQQR
jgi:hypothetical protein